MVAIGGKDIKRLKTKGLVLEDRITFFVLNAGSAVEGVWAYTRESLKPFLF